MRRRFVVVSDFALSFMWVCSGVLLKSFVKRNMSFNHSHVAEIVKIGFSIANMFFYAFIAKIFHGGTNNPLATLVDAISGDFRNFIFCIASRIPAQVIGYIVGVKLLMNTIPEVGHGPRLNVDIYRGALTEGILTFAIVVITLGIAATKIRGSFFLKTWISSIIKLTLHKLGSDLTGGCMNPASVMGWAFARGDHISKEHLFVYWLAPIEATLLAVGMFKLLLRHVKKHKMGSKNKSD
ncbi:MIP aquaporin (TC 1.A.8) [Trifolium repens]|nr:MIP aquaporin (TC 1.A.8) [Trifolium repens]